jgi:hypothetical protein
MEEFLKLYGSGDSAAMAFGIFLAFLGLFAPKKFFGIEFDWKPATSAVALFAGVAFFAFSYPQLRFWQSNTVNVDRAVLTAISAQIKEAHDRALGAASNTSDNPGCVDRANLSVRASDAAAKLVNDLQPNKLPSQIKK